MAMLTPSPATTRTNADAHDGDDDWHVLPEDDWLMVPDDGSVPACATCKRVGCKLFSCAKCLSEEDRYCGKACQRLDWPRHKLSCVCSTSSEPQDLVAKWRAATQVAKQKEGRLGTSVSGFRPRSEWVEFGEPKTSEVQHARRTAPPRVTNQHRALVPRNFERGHQNQGQGCRHQNAAVRVQPKAAASGARQAKWSSSRGSNSYTRKNHKARL